MFDAIKVNDKHDSITKVHIKEYKRVKVYSIRNDKNGYPQFLIYENEEWKYVSAKHFKPVDEDR